MFTEVLDYKIIKSFGKENSFLLYSALDQKNNTIVNLKTLNLNDFNQDEVKKVLNIIESDIKIISKFENNNIQKIIDFGKKEYNYFVVTENIISDNLSKTINSINKLSLGEIIKLSMDICLPLEYCHNKNILHKDLELANIIVDNNQIKLVNFGLYKPNISINSAPEQIIGSSEYNIKSEIYCLGLVLYQLFTGKFPYSIKTQSEIINKIMNEEIISMNIHKDNIPNVLERIIIKALKRNPNDRYNSVQEIYLALKDIKDFYTRN